LVLTAIVASALGVCYYTWASDWFQAKPNFMSGMFCGVYASFVIVLALA
jgi:cell division protein FtsX